jgi:hypothetical protein
MKRSAGCTLARLDRAFDFIHLTHDAAAASILLPATYEHLIFGQRERIRTLRVTNGYCRHLIGASRGRHQCVLAGHLAYALSAPECLQPTESSASMPLYGQSSGSPPRFMHRRCTPARALACCPNLVAQTEDRVGPRFRLPSVDRRHPPSVGMGGAFFHAFVPAAKAPNGSL